MSDWIWLDPALEPDFQTCPPCFFGRPETDFHYAAAEFCRNYSFDREIRSVRLRVSGDTVFRFRVNDADTGLGPVNPGGDFLCTGPAPRHYACRYELPVSGKELRFFAQVRLSPAAACEYSRGHGGFMLEGEVFFEDGTVIGICTDRSWSARRNRFYTGAASYDETVLQGEWHPAFSVPDLWHAEDAPIPNLREEEVLPQNAGPILLKPGETKTCTVLFEKILPAHLCLCASGACSITAGIFELEGQDQKTETVRFAGKSSYRSFSMYSVGGYELTIRNDSGSELSVSASADMRCYPVETEGSFRCSDPGLNLVYDVCKWTLRICRQTIHLDSPKHQEPLACTGDYNIEALMTAFTFGDMRLAELDLRRTADWLYENDGVMFHPTYSLIWVTMLLEVYRFTGKKDLLSDCTPALDRLLARFETYLGDNGLIENPPNWMFVDWLVEEGFSMHHPPKSLGQTCMNAFCHGALKAAENIYALTGQPEKSRSCREKAALLREACSRLLFDETEGLYFDGLSTPQAASGEYLPENVPLRHFSRHANVLAVLFGLCEGEQAKNLLIRTLTSDTMQQVQPYFMHYVLNAVWEQGLFDRFGMDLLRMWKPLAAECSKGLQEGWFAPEEGYSFDHSHAWGGTPSFQLPARLLGFEMLEPGFRKISLSPKLYGLDWCRISMPTPYGMLSVSMNRGEAPKISAPEGLNWMLK